jgi:hypothetical protein
VSDALSFPNIENAMAQILQDDTYLSAIAVDTLAAGLIKNTLGASVVRQSGRIEDPLTYGFIMNTATATLPAHPNGALTNSGMNLAQCLDTLIRTGPFAFSDLTYFRPYAADFQFSDNADLVDKREQQEVAFNAMVQAAYILPLSTLGFLLAVFYFDRGWDRKYKNAKADANGRIPMPSASRLPPLSGPGGDDNDDGEALVK